MSRYDASQPPALLVRPTNRDENPEELWLEVDILGSPGSYQELQITVVTSQRQTAVPRPPPVASIVVGLNPDNELRVSLTKGNDGHSEYAVSLFPCRTEGTFIEQA